MAGGLTPIDVFNQYSNNRQGFINQMAPGGGKPASDAAAMWDNFKRINPGGSVNTGGTNTNSGGNTTSFLDKFNPLEKIKNAAVAGVATQEQSGYMPGMREEMITLSGMADGLLTSLTGPGKLLKTLETGLGAMAGQAELYLKQQTELLGVMNKQAGLTGQFSEDVRNELTMANVPLVRLGIGFEELAGAAKSLVTESGRFITLNRDSWYEAGEAAAAYVGTLSELVSMYPSFEKIGIGASDVAKQIEITGNRSISLGLQSSKTTKELGTNLSRLNEFGFKNGVQGLAEMVRKSTELRMNMDSVFKIADDVMDPEKAISLSANMQVLGGAIGDFNDPLKMMYDATNNVEGLQDALIGAAGSLATYNSEQGRFEITGVNLRRAKAMAAELGISYGELANGAIAAAERTSAATALMGRGLKLDDDQQRFLTNISQMKDGQMTIELNSDRLKDVLGVDRSQGSIALEKLTQKQVDTILEYQNEFKKLSPEEIIQKQATDVEIIGRNVSFLAAAARVRAAQAGGGMLDAIKKMVGYDPGDMRKKVNDVTAEGAKLLGFPMNNKGKVEPLESVKVDQTTKKTEEKPNNQNQQMTEESLANAVTKAINSTKYDKNKPITINNNLEPYTPGSYLELKI